MDEQTATVGTTTVTTRVYDLGASFIIHVIEDGKHTGNSYRATTEAERDELLSIILGN